MYICLESLSGILGKFWPDVQKGRRCQSPDKMGQNGTERNRVKQNVSSGPGWSLSWKAVRGGERQHIHYVFRFN